MPSHPVIIIGAGPAGLTAAYLLSKANRPVVILESDPTYVGGIAKTVCYKGYYFDIGGHRFFSKAPEVEALWSEILPNDFLTRPRISRIFYRQKFFSYPLKAFEALKNLGIIESIRCILSFLKAKICPIKNPISFSDWVTNQFGARLFTIFFKTYTEKVWGMPCEQISADWAAQRIKGLSLLSALLHSLPIHFFLKKKKLIKSLIHTFKYPRKGPGMLWEICTKKIIQQGGQVIMNAKASSYHYEQETKTWVITYQTGDQVHTIRGSELISSAPLRELVLQLSPGVSEETKTAACQLNYRDFLMVVLILKDHRQLPDNWLYIHDKTVRVARIQNFKAWSSEMIPDQTTCCYGMEYFCFEDDSFWQSSDEELIQIAKKELVQLGLTKFDDIFDGSVVRQLKAYPVYDHQYQHHVDMIRKELETKFNSLHLVGRNGMHKYNNQDHAMMTAMLTVKNILAGKREYDVFAVNQDAEYLEAEGNHTSGLRAVPKSL